MLVVVVEHRLQRLEVDARLRGEAGLGDARRVGHRQLVLAGVVDADDLHGAVALAQRAGAAARLAAGRVDDHAEEAAAALGQPLALLRVLHGDLLHRQVA